jgi:hypothetical protein
MAKLPPDISQPRRKNNMQLPEGSKAAVELGQKILIALERNPSVHLCCLAAEGFSATF